MSVYKCGMWKICEKQRIGRYVFFIVIRNLFGGKGCFFHASTETVVKFVPMQNQPGHTVN